LVTIACAWSANDTRELFNPARGHIVFAVQIAAGHDGEVKRSTSAKD
jgi:hypothetical protein